MSNKIEAGSHSQSLGAILTHEQYERIYNVCLKKGHTKSKDDAISKKSWLNCFALKEKGIKVFLFAKYGKYYRIRIQLDSSLTIDKNAPTGLLINSKDIKKMTTGVDKALNDLNVPLKLDSMKMGRIDLTINIIFSSNKERMQPDCRKYLRYKDALSKIEKAKLSIHTRERMLYLLRKTSDSETLNAAIKKMKEKFSLSKSQCDTILKKFSKLGFSPITLTNDSEYEELPSFPVILSRFSAV